LKWRCLPRGRWLLALSAGALWLLSIPHGAWLLSLPLHEALETPPAAAAEAGAIVALAGGVLPPTPSLPFPLPLTDTVASAEKAAWTYLNWKPLPILLCGGLTDAETESTPYADAMRGIVMQRGVPESDIWTERQSGSTYENAKFAAAILKLKGIKRVVLITDHLHYKRARLSFENQGILVDPAVIGNFAVPRLDAMSLLPSVGALRLSQQSIHELGGLVVYWLTNKI
jgi:uncharacterized SAM-binding protein YcdF (DUF218 family)